MEVNFYKSLPSDLNTPNPFSTGYKCHQPSGKYIEKEYNIVEGLKNNFKIDRIYKEWWKSKQNNRVGSTSKAHLLHQHIAIYSWKMGKIFPEIITTSCPLFERIDLIFSTANGIHNYTKNTFSYIFFKTNFCWLSLHQKDYGVVLQHNISLEDFYLTECHI